MVYFERYFFNLCCCNKATRQFFSHGKWSCYFWALVHIIVFVYVVVILHVYDNSVPTPRNPSYSRDWCGRLVRSFIPQEQFYALAGAIITSSLFKLLRIPIAKHNTTCSMRGMGSEAWSVHSSVFFFSRPLWANSFLFHFFVSCEIYKDCI